MAGDKIVGREFIFRAVKGTVGGSLGRTFAECLYWSQYAKHQSGNAPQIYKTGAELGRELGMSARTANLHLKKLARFGYWRIDYKPKPGHPSLVTWLTFLEPAAAILGLARSLHAEMSQGGKKVKEASVECSKSAPLTVAKTDLQQSQNETLKHYETAPTTSKGQKKSFLLSKEQQKQASGTKEISAKESKSPGKGTKIKAPGYAKASKESLEFAGLVQNALIERKLPDWDWSSQYTWLQTEEIRIKLQEAGVDGKAHLSEFLERVLCNWDWLRGCMSSRYSQHDLNLHRPSPMALAFEFENITKAVKSKYGPKEIFSAYSSLDDGF